MGNLEMVSTFSRARAGGRIDINIDGHLVITRLYNCT